MNLKPVNLSIIIPCYNPAFRFFERILEHLVELEKSIPISQVILVNDGSSENFIAATTLNAFSDKNKITLISYDVNRGKGYALRQGVKQAKGDLILYTDVDFPYTTESLVKIYSELNAGAADVAVGIRDEEYYAHLPAARVRISKLLRWFIKKFLAIPTDDTQCGLKGMNRKGKEIFLKTTIDRYLFDLEFIFLSARNNLKIKTVSVKLRPEVELSKMNWKVLIQEFGNFLRIFMKSMFSAS